MKSKPHTPKSIAILLRTSIGLGVAGLIGLGLTGCDNNDATPENPNRMEEPMNNSQNNPTGSPMGSPTPDSTASTSPNESPDAWITAKVKTELLADDVSKGFDVEVTTVDGVVSLDGTVKDADSVMHIEQMVSSVEGVSQVDTSGLKLEEARTN